MGTICSVCSPTIGGASGVFGTAYNTAALAVAAEGGIIHVRETAPALSPPCGSVR